jgi:hypothetical protein
MHAAQGQHEGRGRDGDPNRRQSRGRASEHPSAVGTTLNERIEVPGPARPGSLCAVVVVGGQRAGASLGQPDRHPVISAEPGQGMRIARRIRPSTAVEPERLRREPDRHPVEEGRDDLGPLVGASLAR